MGWLEFEGQYAMRPEDAEQNLDAMFDLLDAAKALIHPMPDPARNAFALRRIALTLGGDPRQLEALLATDPHQLGERATKWTVPLLLTHLRRAGAEVSEHALRRTLHWLGWRWKRPRYELGQPDPAYALKNKGSWSKSGR